MTPKTKTVFRTWRDTNEVIALFPEIPHDRHGDLCESYMHVGQHSGAYPGPIEGTRPSAPDETVALHRELESIGYRLEVRKRITPTMHTHRLKAARR